MARQNVADEPTSGPEQPEPGFIQGYQSSTPASADAPNYPGNQVWNGIGSSTDTYKAHWKNKPRVFPYGTNDEGGK